MPITMQPVRVGNGHDEDGRLVFADERLVAVLVRLSDPGHGETVGLWFVEVGFGRLARDGHPTFASLDEAQDWVARRH